MLRHGNEIEPGPEPEPRIWQAVASVLGFFAVMGVLAFAQLKSGINPYDPSSIKPKEPVQKEGSQQPNCEPVISARVRI
jgi:hypothetical protein